MEILKEEKKDTVEKKQPKRRSFADRKKDIKEDLVNLINHLTKEIEGKNEVIMNYETTMVARDKEDRLLKQTIKEINKRYSDAEEMYEQVSVTLEKCMQDNDKLKQDLIQKKNVVVTRYKFLGMCVLTKISD
jgi:translation initiation factor 2B subunit (eIF-2B alpha/beta/delta family)